LRSSKSITSISAERAGLDASKAIGAPGSNLPAPGPVPGPAGCPPVLFDSPYSIIIHHCPECEKYAIAGKRGELIEVEDDLVERAICDGSVYEDHNGRTGRRKRSISPAVRKKVFMRDRGVCRTPGCGRTSFLEVHHVVPISEGGNNKPENLLLLCSLCRYRHKLHYADFRIMPIKHREHYLTA